MIPLDIEAAQKGSLRQLADDLFWARFDLPFRLNHINLYMLATAEGWVLIDTGLNNEITAQHWQALLKGPLAGKPVYQIIVTHHHVDHIGYAGPLAALTGAQTFSSLAETEHAKWLYALADEDFGNLLAETYHRYGLPTELVKKAARTEAAVIGAIRRLCLNLVFCGQEMRSKHLQDLGVSGQIKDIQMRR